MRLLSGKSENRWEKNIFISESQFARVEAETQSERLCRQQLITVHSMKPELQCGTRSGVWTETERQLESRARDSNLAANQGL